MDALKDSFNEGNTCALGTRIHEAQVLKSTGPEHILCREEYDENSIVCSVSNLNVTFNVIHVVSFCINVTHLSICHGRDDASG